MTCAFFLDYLMALFKRLDNLSW
jgi:hypothetical protein